MTSPAGDGGRVGEKEEKGEEEGWEEESRDISFCHLDFWIQPCLKHLLSDLGMCVCVWLQLELILSCSMGESPEEPLGVLVHDPCLPQWQGAWVLQSSCLGLNGWNCTSCSPRRVSPGLWVQLSHL